MKKTGMMLLVFGFLALIAACGGSDGGGGSSTAKEAADASIAGFANIAEAIQACTPSGTPPSCECSGGGTVVLTGGSLASMAVTEKATASLEANNCKDATTGLQYDGTMSVDTSTGAATMEFTLFGECTNVTGTAAMSETCNGSVSGTCAGEHLECNVVSGASGECVCE